MASWEPFVAAAFAPAIVWLLWRAQTMSVELLRWRLVKLTTVRDLRWVYSLVSWFGVLLHELSHASVLLLSGHGIRQFRAGVESGHVLPARMRTGPISFLSFLLAALAPLFVPPLLFLLALHLLADASVLSFRAPEVGLAAAVEGLRGFLVEVPAAIGMALAGLDLATWQGAVLLVAALLLMPSSRPSHVKGSRFHGTKDEGDVAVLRARIRANPVVFLLFLAVLYAAYFLVPFHPPSYWYPFQALWSVALAGVALALFGAAAWSLVGLARHTHPLAWWLGPAAFVATQILLHAMGFEPLLRNALAALAWLATAAVLRLAVPRRRGP